MSAQEASRGMRSTPPCALTLNTLTLNNHPRPTVRQAACAEPTAKLSANQRSPALHHSTTLCNSPLATADTRASARNCILRAPPPLDSHATDRERHCCCHRPEQPTGVASCTSTYKLCTATHFLSHAKIRETHASLPQAKRTGVWTKDKPAQDSYQAAALGAALQASCASLACHSVPRRIM